MRNYRTRVAATLVVVPALLCLGALSGCGRRAEGASKNVLRYAIPTQPTALDPAIVEDGDTIDLLQQIFEGLVQWNEKNEVVSNIAEKWTVSPDGTVYTFTLKDNVYFHNPFRRKVTAEDFVYSLTRALAKETASPSVMTYLNDIVGAQDLNDGKTKTLAGVKAVDERTFQITIDKSRPYFLAKLTYPTAYVVCKEAIEKNEGKFGEKTMIGTGPFRLRAYQPGYNVSLVANEEYHGGKPAVDGIERPIVMEGVTRQTKYESGELDITDVNRAELESLQKDPKLGSELKEYQRANIYYLALNQQAFEPFRKAKVRQAFAYAINKDDLVKIVLRGTADKANGIMPPGLPGYNSGFQGIPYDPAKAKMLLAEAGYPDGKDFPKLVISYRQGWPHLKDGTLAIINDLKKNLNIPVEGREVEWAVLLNERRNGTLPAIHLRWAADYLDPQNFLSIMLGTGASQNHVGYSNPEFDRLCNQADTEPDPAKRQELYRQAEKIAVEDAPWVCLYHLRDVELIKPNVKSLRDNLLGHLPHVTTSVAR